MAPRLPDNSDERITAVQSATNGSQEKTKESDVEYKLQIVWRNVILFAFLHIAALYGIKLMLTDAKWQTNVIAFLMYIMSGLGITAGAHRLWSHRSYKAKWPLRVILCVFNCLAFQNDIYEWSRDHRVHHTYSETDADPHNATRGFFFAHMGWLLCKKHPNVYNKGSGVDCSDILADPIVRFQRRNYLALVALCCFILPTVIPWLLWGETKWNAFFICAIFRYCFTLHTTWLVNSAAHMWGNHPYDKNINPTENLGVALGAIGEGYHNYHHTFPYDYAASEYGWKINITTMFIDGMAKIGWAYDRKKVSENVLRMRIERTGDGSHPSAAKQKAH
ncbi:acyl-CoA Delta-9 desaturase-like [Brevipalpus obovatus]|uniref:acyl-CoA Delta-9 desaturase-like n=1 Tax=Brevipalpus obovatus TaxID=246614 RepID=UPI003D9E7740